MSADRAIIAAMIELASICKGDWESTIQHILKAEARVLDVERVSFWTLRDELGEGKVLVCEMAYHRTTGVFERGSRLGARQHADYFAAILSASPVAIEDVRIDPRVRSLRKYLDERCISSLLDFPIWARGAIAGVLCLEHVGPPRLWSTSDVRFAATVAQTATTALEARARAEAQESAVRAAFLENVSRTLGETLDVEEVARRALALMVPSFADGAMIDLVDEGAIRRVAFDYATPEGRALFDVAMRVRRNPRAGGGPYIPERVLARRDAILLSDVTDAAFAEAELHSAYPEFIAVTRTLGIRSMVAAPLFIGERIVGVVTCISVKRRFGLDDLGRAEAFARRLASALENARLHQRAQAAVRARDEFIALAGHELRTPLTSLLLTAQKLVRRAESAPRKDIEQIAGKVVKQLNRLERLSAQMLDATRIAENRLALSRAPTDLAEIARDTAEMFEPLLQREGGSLVVRADAPVVGEWDATQLERLLSNLLENAVKFAAGKPIEIAVQRESEDALLTVRDHGPGIPADRVASIFEAFERAVSPDHHGGLGLGLFVARAIAESHGGALTVDNRPGEGATFTARLPLKPPPEPDAEARL